MLEIPRARIERLARAKAKFVRDYAKVEQAQRGFYDDNGIRQGGLIAFVRYFWSIIEPDRPLVDGWPVWAMCEHLEAVTAGEITRLLINVPPGFMKSLLVDVFWPAWEWGPMGKPHYRYVAFSYSATLTERDNERFRALVASERYQRLYGPFRLRSEKGHDVETRKLGEDEVAQGVTLANKTTLKVKNTRTGWKFASSVGGVGTGERGDRVILDDPHNVKDSESEVVRQETVRWFRESLSSRFNDLDSGALIIIMQRVHEDDVAGTILSLGFDYCHLMIPWEYDSERQISNDGGPVATEIGWTDPRYDEDAPYGHDGEAAWPGRFSDAAMARTKTEIGPYGWAAQFQQAPAPRGGGIFQRSWWQLYEPPDGKKFPPMDYVLASLDSAYTEKEENDPSALTIWGVFSNPVGLEGGCVEGGHIWQSEGVPTQRRIMLVHAWRKHLQFSADRLKIQPLKNEVAMFGLGPKNPTDAIKWQRWRRRTQEHWGLIEWVVDTCNRFPVDKLLIEAKASGISAAQELANRFGSQRWGIQLCKVVGDKYARALAVQPTFSQGLIYAPARDWAEMVIDEMAVFPKGKYKDLTDSATQAVKHLRDIGQAQTDDEMHAAEMEGVTHRPRPKAIYPV